MTNGLEGRRRWLALYVLCTGVLMVVLDTTVVVVALPTIQADLGFSGTTLVWVLNAYMLTFGGFLLLGGRLGDLYGSRRWFLIGLSLFTAASLACGLSDSPATLVAARAVQGLGGAVVTAVALSLIINLFTEPAERAQAMADALPDARLVVLPGAGHLTPVEQPERVTALITDFLAQLKTPA